MRDQIQDERLTRFGSAPRTDPMDLLREQAGAELASIPPDEDRVRKAEQELMEQAGNDRCVLCGKPLPFLVRLKKGQFCSPHHEREYNAKLAETAVSRLAEFRSRRPVVPMGHDRRIRFRTPTQQPRTQEKRLDLELLPIREAQWVEAKSAAILRPRAGHAPRQYVGWRPQAFRDLPCGVRTDVPHALGEADWSTAHASAVLSWAVQPASEALRLSGLRMSPWLETAPPVAVRDSGLEQASGCGPDAWNTHGTLPAWPEMVTRNARSCLSAAKLQNSTWDSVHCLFPEQPESCPVTWWVQGPASQAAWPHSPTCVNCGSVPEAQPRAGAWSAEPLLSPEQPEGQPQPWAQGAVNETACPPSPMRVSHGRVSEAQPRVGAWSAEPLLSPEQTEGRTQPWAQGAVNETAWPPSPMRVSHGRVSTVRPRIGTWSACPLFSPPQRNRGAETWVLDTRPAPSPRHDIAPARTTVSPAMGGVGRAGWKALMIAPQGEVHTAWSAPTWCARGAVVAMQPYPGNAGVTRLNLERRPAVQLPHCEPVPAEEMARPQRLERLRLPSLRLNIPA